MLRSANKPAATFKARAYTRSNNLRNEELKFPSPQQQKSHFVSGVKSTSRGNVPQRVVLLLCTTVDLFPEGENQRQRQFLHLGTVGMFGGCADGTAFSLRAITAPTAAVPRSRGTAAKCSQCILAPEFSVMFCKSEYRFPLCTRFNVTFLNS